MPCHNCRGPISEIDRFCPECGSPVGIDSFVPTQLPNREVIWFGNRLLKIGWGILIFSCAGVLAYFLSGYLPKPIFPYVRTFGLAVSIPGLPLILIITPLNIIFSVIRFKSLDRTEKLLFFVYTPIILIMLAFVVVPVLLAFIDFLTGGLFLYY